jgi:hypothetical protein
VLYSVSEAGKVRNLFEDDVGPKYEAGTSPYSDEVCSILLTREKKQSARASMFLFGNPAIMSAWRI